MQRLQSHHLSSNDTHPADVKAMLAKRGLTLAALARRHNREDSYFRAALVKPFPAAMRRIAKALGVQPHQLWPSLFDEDNKRIRRLRPEESRAVPTMRGGKHHK